MQGPDPIDPVCTDRPAEPCVPHVGRGGDGLLPVISVPVTAPGALPLGVQLVAAPFREASLFRVAAHLEAAGVL